jgi:hypothetical protein
MRYRRELRRTVRRLLEQKGKAPRLFQRRVLAVQIRAIRGELRGLRDQPPAAK